MSVHGIHILCLLTCCSVMNFQFSLLCSVLTGLIKRVDLV